MITRYNKFENKLNEDNTPSWFEEKIVKPSDRLYNEYGKKITNPFGDDEITSDLKKLYNTPIANIPVYVYAQLMGILNKDRVNLLQLQSPITKESSMIELAFRYYIIGITQILDSINKVNVDFNATGIDEETANALKSNPITIGTIIRNSLISWLSSKKPVDELVSSLNTAVIKPKSETVTETYIYINESRMDAFTKWISKLFKGGEELSNIAKASDDVARASQYSKLNVSDPTKRISMSFKPAETQEEALKRMAQSSDEYIKNINNAPKDIQDAVSQRTLNLKKEASGIDLKNVDPKSIPSPTGAKVPDVEAKTISDLSSNYPVDRNKTEETKSLFEKLKEKLKNRAKNKDLDLTQKPKRTSLIKKLTNSIKAIVKFFTVGGFLLKIPIAAWSIVKYGGIAYGIYWIAKYFEKNDNDSAKEPTRELLSVFEKDMATKKYEPFVTYDNAGMRFKEALGSENVRDLISSWCISLNESDILSDSDYKKCIEQIESEAFDYYMVANSTVSKNFVNGMEQEWEKNYDLPSLGLMTMGLISAYSSVFHKFENEFYKGNIPLTADTKNLDRPVGIIGRKDISGQERKYMQIGDEGEDVKLLQQSLNKLGIYSGDIDGKYDEELAKIIAAMQTNAKPTDTQIEVNGKADLAALNYIAKQIEFLSGAVIGSLEGTFTPEKSEKREQTQRYIQQMQTALASR
jgi:hypothetical protein